MSIIFKIRSRNRLKEILQYQELENLLSSRSDLISASVTDLPECNKYTKLIDNNFESILTETNRLSKNVELLATKLTNDINHYAQEKYAESEYYFNTESYLDKEVIKKLAGRLSVYANWRFPALQFNCTEPAFVKCMVAADPLYLISDTEEDINKTKLLFSEEYRRRVRFYTHAEIDLLPPEQFSLIASIDYVNYMNPTKISNYLANMFFLLRPGGVVIFTYNNCEVESSANLTEEKIMAWNTETDLSGTIRDLGYEIIRSTNVDNSSPLISTVSWFEIKKPGILVTQKAHQVLGKIHQK